MKHAFIAALLAVLVPLQASALDNDDVLALAAMPLAVAAASEVSGVPVGDLSHFVTTLNRAYVPPAQVIQVVRYAPAAFVVRDDGPRFVEFVDQQYYQGVTGSSLVTVIEDRYRTHYDLEPQILMFDAPAPAYVIRDDYIPPVVVTRVARYAPAYAVRDSDDLLALAAMPLAVAAVSNISGVPVSDLSHFVATLNLARVPPTQFVQVVRYAPAAFVVRDSGPTFVEFVDQQYYGGYTGTRLVRVIENRYRSYYDLEPQYLMYDGPMTTYVVRDDYIPPVVVTRVAQYAPAYYGSTYYAGNNLLGLVAMPLAVAAVADMSGVPINDLTMLVASLNAARMPPMQVVEVLRYAPAPLYVDSFWYDEPRFVPYVRAQVLNGVRGPALFDVIGQQLRTYDVIPRYEPIRSPDVVFVRDEYFPPIVRTRVADVRVHPHGGPPGQLKKELGLQTGAEVVHGTRPGWVVDERVVRSARVDRDDPWRPDVDRRRPVDQRRIVRDGEWKKAERPRPQRERQQLDRSRGSEKSSVQRSKKADRPQRLERQREQRVKPQRMERQRTQRAAQHRLERPRSGRSASVTSQRSRGSAKVAAGDGRAEGNAKTKGKGKGNTK
ncbi:MAG: hypothetical protein ACYC7A_02945 [Thermoanaerobaculia bacterium]